MSSILPFLDNEAKGFIARKGLGTISALVKNAMAIDQFTGADKNTLLKLPKDGVISDEEALQKIHDAIGVPQDGKYEPYTRDEGQISLPDTEIAAFDAVCAKTGVTPNARKAMLDLFYQMNDTAQQNFVSRHNEGVNTQKAEWGQAYDARKNAALRTLKNVDGGADLLAMFESQKIDDHPALLKFGYALAELTAEDGNHGSGTGVDTPMTPDQARAAFEKFSSENSAILTGQRGTPYEKRAAMAELDRLARAMSAPKTV